MVLNWHLLIVLKFVDGKNENKYDSYIDPDNNSWRLWPWYDPIVIYLDRWLFAIDQSVYCWRAISGIAIEPSLKILLAFLWENILEVHVHSAVCSTLTVFFKLLLEGILIHHIIHFSHCASVNSFNRDIKALANYRMIFVGKAKVQKLINGRVIWTLHHHVATQVPRRLERSHEWDNLISRLQVSKTVLTHPSRERNVVLNHVFVDFSGAEDL